MHDLNFAVVWSLLIFASCGSLRSCVFLACISVCRQYNPSNWSIDGYKFHEKYFVFQKKKKKRNEDYWTFWGLFDLENITVSSYSMSYMRKNVQLTQIVVVKDIFGSLSVRGLVEMWWVWTLSWYTPARFLRSLDQMLVAVPRSRLMHRGDQAFAGTAPTL